MADVASNIRSRKELRIFFFLRIWVCILSLFFSLYFRPFFLLVAKAGYIIGFSLLSFLSLSLSLPARASTSGQCQCPCLTDFHGLPPPFPSLLHIHLVMVIVGEPRKLTYLSPLLQYEIRNEKCDESISIPFTPFSLFFFFLFSFSFFFFFPTYRRPRRGKKKDKQTNKTDASYNTATSRQSRFPKEKKKKIRDLTDLMEPLPKLRTLEPFFFSFFLTTFSILEKRKKKKQNKTLNKGGKEKKNLF